MTRLFVLDRNFAPALYDGTVMHQRLRPRRHHLRYRVFSLLLDLDGLPDLAAGLRLFTHNRWGLFSFCDRDHGDGHGGPLRPWVERQLTAAGLEPAGGAIHVLCYPRILGYVFNPLTVFFCYGATGTLMAMLYEVSNRHGERHTYVMPVEGTPATPLEQSCPKEFYVSPFIAMDCRYRMRITAPGETVSVRIEDGDAQGPLLTAVFAGRRRALSDRALLRTFFAYPLMTLKVTAGIHWEALRLLLKGIPVIRHRRAAAPIAVSIIRSLDPRHQEAHP